METDVVLYPMTHTRTTMQSIRQMPATHIASVYIYSSYFPPIPLLNHLLWLPQQKGHSKEH